MREVSFKLDSKVLEKLLKEAPKVLNDEVAKSFNRAGVEFVAAMDENFQGVSSPPFWANTGTNLVSRTGNLARSLGFSVRKGSSLNQLRGFVFVGDAVTGRYATTQEFGATINGSPWLTIPLPDNYTASGVPRWQSAAALRDRPDVETWVQRSAAGNLIIKARFDGSDEVKNLWVLKKQVTVPARLGFTKTFKDRQAANVKLVQNALQRAFQRAKQGAGA